jgi:hypothetical protein
MLDNYFQIDHADKTFFIRKTSKETLIVRIYVNDIVLELLMIHFLMSLALKVKVMLEAP